MKQKTTQDLKNCIADASRLSAQLAANAFSDRVKYAKVIVLLHESMSLVDQSYDTVEVAEVAHAEPG